tara:strand:- start:158 stop:544 length:387 start_codon:yes stop_codon:yes gene_type:complete
MIKGIGIDIVDKSRIKDIHSKHGIRFENKILSLKELEELSERNNSNKISYLSNNFACKEACSKALGKGFSNGVKFKDIEVLRNSSGGPFINLKGEASVIANDLKINNIHVSITDSKESSMAFVIGELL